MKTKKGFWDDVDSGTVTATAIMVVFFGGLLWYSWAIDQANMDCMKKYPGSVAAGPVLDPVCEMRTVVGQP